MQENPSTDVWRLWTEPHAGVLQPSLRRRTRLAASLLLVLVPTVLAFVLVYATPMLPGGGPRSVVLSLCVLAAFTTTYVLVRGPHPTIGILLLVLAPLVVIATALYTSPEDRTPAYFSIIPVLLAALLLEFRAAFALAAVNIVTMALLLLGVSAGAGSAGSAVSPLLFLATASPAAVIGAAFMERSIREAEAATERLREADAFRMRLLNTVVHDLNTPLTPIFLQVSLLERVPGQERKTAILRRNIDILRRLVSDIADLAKIEGGHLRLNKEPVDLAHVARSATEDLRQKADEKGVEVRLDAPPCPVRGDDGRLTQVFHNLLTNAIKFTPPGGRVHVEVEPTPVPTARVRDTGRGLHEEEIARLFHPFSQVHAPSEADERGTGLGLYITKSIVEAHGGTAWVESAGFGHGSMFAFTLPPVDAHGPKAGHPVDAGRHPGPGTPAPGSQGPSRGLS